MNGFVAKTARVLLDSVLEWHFRGAGRVAVFGPGPQDHLDAVLESDDDIQYVDCGRGYDWRPREDGLKLVLTDGARMIWVGSPNYPTGTSCDLASLESVIQGYPDVLLMVDQRWETSLEPQFRRGGPQTLFLNKVKGEGDTEEFILWGSPLQESDWESRNRVEWSVNRTPFVQRVEEGERRRLMASLEGFPYRVTPGVGECLFVQSPGEDTTRLAETLEAQGFSVVFESVHTWRNGVCVKRGNHDG